jgi:hypothetical protein
MEPVSFHLAITRRLIIFFFFGLGGFIFSIWAGSHFDDEKQRLLCATLVILGIIFLLGSLGLLIVTQYPATWGWWL